MSRPISYLLAAMIWTLCFAGLAYAAEIKRTHDYPGGLILEGAIEPGDYDKLLKLIDEDCPHFSYACASSIYLASPGGNVVEAMKIGRLVRTLRWTTRIPEVVSPDLRSALATQLKLKDPGANFMCASACFFVYVAGFERDTPCDAWASQEPLFERHRGILGIHRPFMSDAELETLSVNQAMASAIQVRSVVETYLKEMGVPSKYADMMFSVPKDQVRWIDAADFKADFSGFIPELKDWVDARCNNKRKHMTDDEILENFVCMTNLRLKLHEDAWNTFKRQ